MNYIMICDSALSLGTLTVLSLCLIGHVGFTISLMYANKLAALFFRAIFGLGQGSTVVAQGRIAACWFVGREMTLAIALTELTHNLSNLIAMTYVVPVSNWMGGYIYSLWMGAIFCVISLIAGMCYYCIPFFPLTPISVLCIIVVFT